MLKKPLIMGIETSCDETAASIIQDDNSGIPKILSNVVSSQFDVHKDFGGVVPDLAARSHAEKIDLIVEEALIKSKKEIKEIDAFAATAGPGLIVCLTVGLNFAKAVSLSLNKPFIGVNHLEGHALSPKLHTNLHYPYLLFLISGGHTQFLIVNSLGNYTRIGTTIDDAIGEAYDKTAKLLGIEFPGGPKVETLAKKGDPNKFKLPLPIINKGGCNLSFAGLKTAVLKIVKNIRTDQDKFDLAASFQNTIEKIVIKKTQLAFDEYLKLNNKKRDFVVAGGVAANKGLRKKIEELSYKNKFNIIFPTLDLCGDNAAMIGMVGLEKYKIGEFSKHDFKVNPRWQLDENAKFLKGAGVIL
ncbi:MAG: tRNA (adenosine(37)-N6)-threonylcarbamoyltransferase complex transferase subunit TsaD [Flavobacteriales bacterium]|nr:tRNA (adenosine(37)-N6)-threonylcarbamoyltransferase complex transferase subunit TsaD [Flavobacteriales bacterium]|tara:strand:- start:3252 stop:4322 length:1071 start_codon:yes stop_codon:yes gene_type:complete